MSDELSQEELDKLIAEAQDEGLSGGDGGGLSDQQIVELAAAIRPAFAALADGLGDRIGRDVVMEFAAAEHVTLEALADDVEKSGLFIYFSAQMPEEGGHGLVIERAEAALLGALLAGEEPTDAISADELTALVDFFAATLPTAAAAVQEESGVATEFGAPAALHMADPAAQFDPVTLGLGEDLVQVELVVEGGEGLSGSVRYVLPLAHARALLARGAEEEPAAAPEVAPEPEPVKPVFAEFDSAQESAPEPAVDHGGNMGLILDIQLDVTARLGSVKMPIREILKLAPGSIIDIDRAADGPVDLVVNNKLVARGDVVVVQENFGLRINEVQSPQERIASLRK